MSGHEVLRPYVSSILKEVGFASADYLAIESLTEMIQSVITEIGKTSRTFCEVAGRAEPLPADVILALVDLGIQINGLEEYTFRPNRYILPPPLQSTQSKQLSLLSAGSKQHLPSYMPSHLPQFPDPHAYTRTPVSCIKSPRTHKKPVTEYEAIREKAASQKRDLERALNKFKTKTNETESLFFNSENDVFPLIAAKVQPRVYLTALLPKDQVYDDEEEPRSVPVPCKKSKPSKDIIGMEDDEEEEEEEPEYDENNSKGESESIDNPFLRAAKMCPKWNANRKGKM